MNNCVLESIKNLSKDIQDEPIVKEYVRLKKLVDESKSLKKIQKEISYLKKSDMSEKDKEKYFVLVEKYNSNPLIKEFNNVSEEVFNLLNEIKEELEN